MQIFFVHGYGSICAGTTSDLAALFIEVYPGGNQVRIQLAIFGVFLLFLRKCGLLERCVDTFRPDIHHYSLELHGSARRRQRRRKRFGN